MKKILIIFFFFISNTYSAEQWTRVGTNYYPDNNNPKSFATLYIDMSSITRQESLVKAKVLVDMKEPEDYDGNKGERYYSSVIRTHIYDCFNEKDMTRALFYSKNMGKGKVIAINKNEKERWELVELEGINHKLMQIACESK
jgi:hypothetical protein